MRVKNWLAAVGLALVLVPGAVSGQSAEREWAVNVLGGAQLYPKTSSIRTGPFLGIEALYQITPRFAFGPSVDFVRTETDGSWFVSVVNFGPDSSRIYHVGQRLSTLHYTMNGRFDVSPEAQFNPYVVGGIGGHTTYLETESNDGFQRLNALMFQVGGGVRYAITESTGLQIDVRDIVYTNFDREELNPIREAQRNRMSDGHILYPGQERSDYALADETLHNIRFSVGLTYIPGLNR